ncbi:MAG: DUF3848 domain-containing protein [Clostridia bacterium]|nr:DUF3848 domain-containing protein [Clostridia bacterium]
MSVENLRDLLYQKASKEQETYIEHLKTLPPEQIIDRSYEKVMRDDILMTFENDYMSEYLSEKEVKALLKLDYPLSACYDAWMDNDCSHMEMLRDTIEDYAKRLAEEQRQEKEQAQRKRNEPER